MSLSASTACDLLLYTLWADRQVLQAVRQVGAEDLNRDAGISIGSMLGTLAHMMGAERIWLSRFAGVSPDRLQTIEDFPTLPAWIVGWEETAAGLEAFLASLTDEQLAATLTWKNTRGQSFTRPLWQPVLQLVNHTTYHRGQVVSLLRQMGYTAPTTDLIYYFLERAGS